MKEKLERYYDYIINDLLSTTKVDEENRTISLPFPPYVKLNPYDGSDKPIAMIDIKDGIRLRGTNTGYLENMLDNYGLRDSSEVSDIRNRFHKLLVDKYTKFAEDYLNNIADNLLSKIEKERNYLITPFGKFYIRNFRKNTIAYHNTYSDFTQFAQEIGIDVYEERKYLFATLAEKILNRFDNE
jgi:hypothetical protein